jgi:type II secretory pathway component PulJ
MKKKQSGFTLVELMVAVTLMIILVGAIAMVFTRAAEIATISDARHKIYNNARVAMDLMWKDLQALLPVDGGNQQFSIRNGGGDHISTANDQISFHSTVFDSDGNLRVAKVTYRLEKDPDSERQNTLRTGRPLYILRRVLQATDGTSLKNIAGATITPADVCMYVISLNFEYRIETGTNAGTFTNNVAAVFKADGSDPIGDSPPKSGDLNDPNMRISAVRVTMRIVEDNAERQERVISRVIWLPMS